VITINEQQSTIEPVNHCGRCTVQTSSQHNNDTSGLKQLHRLFVFRRGDRKWGLRRQQPGLVVFELVGHGPVLEAEPHRGVALEARAKRQLEDPVPFPEADVLPDVLQLIP